MKDLKTLKIGLLGYGTVGTGVYKLVESQKEEMPHKIGANLSVAKILVRDKTKKRDGIDQSLLTDRFEDIIEDEDIQIVVEVMGGIEPARTYINAALRAYACHGTWLCGGRSHSGYRRVRCGAESCHHGLHRI